MNCPHCGHEVPDNSNNGEHLEGSTKLRETLQSLSQVTVDQEDRLSDQPQPSR